MKRVKRSVIMVQRMHEQPTPVRSSKSVFASSTFILCACAESVLKPRPRPPNQTDWYSITRTWKLRVIFFSLKLSMIFSYLSELVEVSPSQAMNSRLKYFRGSSIC